MILKVFYQEFASFLTSEAIINKGISMNYRDFERSLTKWEAQLYCRKINPGDVVAIHGDFTPTTIGLLFALIENRNIIVPFVYDLNIDISKKIKIASVKHSFFVDESDVATIHTWEDIEPDSTLYAQLRVEKKPGLVLFTSGTSGEPKAVLHDFTKLVDKFVPKRRSFRTLNFLLFDHWGGLNTMFHTLLNGGAIISTRARDPKSVCKLIERHRIELLPTSPSFLNMLLLSEEHLNNDLSSLKKITYGAEPMPQSTLTKMRKEFPKLEFQQTYGLTELGVLRSKSKLKGSLWVKIGGEGFETRVVDDMLEIKAETAMLGYLNAPSPFTEDGFFKTGDQVEVDGEYYKILGRKSEIISVGGLKVHPSEIESVLLEMPSIKDSLVYGEANSILGSIICADIVLRDEEVDTTDLLNEIQSFCKSKLDKHFIPVKVNLSTETLLSSRQKKIRNVV